MFIEQLPFVDSSKPSVVVEDFISQWKNSSDSFILHYLYYSNYVMLFQDEEFRESILLANNLLIDGIGMQLYMQAVKDIWVNNLNGTDLNPLFINTLSQKEIPVALYGTDEQNINQTKQNLIQKGVATIYYIQNGFSPLDWNLIQPKSALFIGLGSPKQELWVKENIDKIRELQLLVVTVGGYFDFESGFYVRAPTIIRKIKLEWLWRTILHPKRHYKKRLRDFSILWKPLIDKIKGYGKFIHLQKLE